MVYFNVKNMALVDIEQLYVLLYIKYANNNDERNKLERIRPKVLKSKGGIYENKDIYSDLLIAASLYGHLDVVKYALCNGADINAFDHQPIFLASRGGYIEIVKYLFKCGAECERALFTAAVYAQYDIVKYMIEQSVNVTYTFQYIESNRKKFEEIYKQIIFKHFNSRLCNIFPPEIISNISSYII